MRRSSHPSIGRQRDILPSAGRGAHERRAGQPGQVGARAAGATGVGATGGEPVGWGARAPAVDLRRDPEGEPVTIVCAEPPADLRETMRSSDPNSPDYTKLHTYADLDSLLEAHGDIWPVNPNIPVNVWLDNSFSAADYVINLVLLGGVDWNDATQLVLEQLASAELSRGMLVGERSRNQGDAEAHFDDGDDRFSPVFAGEESVSDSSKTSPTSSGSLTRWRRCRRLPSATARTAKACWPRYHPDRRTVQGPEYRVCPSPVRRQPDLQHP